MSKEKALKKIKKELHTLQNSIEEANTRAYMLEDTIKELEKEVKEVEPVFEKLVRNFLESQGYKSTFDWKKIEKVYPEWVAALKRYNNNLLAIVDKEFGDFGYLAKGEARQIIAKYEIKYI